MIVLLMCSQPQKKNQHFYVLYVLNKNYNVVLLGPLSNLFYRIFLKLNHTKEHTEKFVFKTTTKKDDKVQQKTIINK